ncbi:MAG: hypothetical protein VW397_06760 [Candidatus Margulisiibacteriota bacterium]
MVIIIQHQKKIVSFKGHDAIDFTISSEEFDQIITEVMELYQKRDITFVTNLFYRSIANLLIQQNHSDKDNIYVEHHHSHSFRVAELILKLTDFYMETQPEAILKLMNELEIINKKTLEFILITVALLHDCNYFIDKKNNELKAIHALKSALSAFNKIDNEFREILRKCRHYKH